MNLMDHIPFLRLLGVYQGPSEPGSSRLVMPELKPDHCNSLAAAHGGVVMTLLDVAMARAAVSAEKAATQRVVTVEMSSRFVAPGKGPLRAQGRVIRAGGSLVTCEAQVTSVDGQLLATAQGTFMYWRGHEGAPGGVD